MKLVSISKVIINSIKTSKNNVKVSDNKVDKSKQLIMGKNHNLAKFKDNFLTKFKNHDLPIKSNYKVNRSEFLTSKAKLVFSHLIRMFIKASIL